MCPDSLGKLRRRSENNSKGARWKIKCTSFSIRKKPATGRYYTKLIIFESSRLHRFYKFHSFNLFLKLPSTQLHFNRETFYIQCFLLLKATFYWKIKKHLIFNFFRKVEFSVMELYNIELYSNQLFTAKFIRNKDPYTFMYVEWFSRNA